MHLPIFERLHGYASGAVDYLTVPVSPDLLRAKVKVFVDLCRKQRELEALKQDLEHLVEERTADLQASEERYRTLIENANDIIATMDLDFRVTSINPAAERLLGYTANDIVGSLMTRFVSPEEAGIFTDLLNRKLEGVEATQYEIQLLAKDGRRFTFEVNSRLMRDSVGQPHSIHAIARDITERKQADSRQNLLVRELQHRTKNMLAVIQSIASRTLRQGPDLEAAQDALLGRLHALGHTQDFIAAGPGGGVPLRDLVDAQIRSFAARSTVSGIPVVLAGGFAQTFALVIHELATNAAKHGALSYPDGKIAIAWTVDRGRPDPVLQFSWVERGGPHAGPPMHRGLGSELLGAVGQPELLYSPSGFEYRVELSLNEALG
jgi:PAS domain S-box-containing protein